MKNNKKIAVLSCAALVASLMGSQVHAQRRGGRSAAPAPVRTAPAAKPATPAVQPSAPRVAPVVKAAPAAKPMKPMNVTPRTATKLPVVAMNVLPISYNVQDRGDAGLNRLDLYVTRDQGRTWKFYVTDKDLQPPVNYHVQEDGRFGFFTVATDKAGNTEATPVSGERPHVSVIVDRTGPTARLIAPRTGEFFNTRDVRTISWRAQDLNLGDKPIALQYSIDGSKTWRDIVRNLPNTGEYKWTPADGSAEDTRVRLVVTDMAGNSTAEATGAFVVDGLIPTSKITGPTRVGSKHFSVEYETSDVGGAGVQSVELWYRVNDGQWKKQGRHSQVQKPVQFAAPVEGYIYFAMVAIDKVGNREENPGQGKRASLSGYKIAVDLTPPSVKLLGFNGGGVYPGRSKQNLTWSATDSNLAARPISIDYSLNDGQTWQTIEKNLPNSGTYAWTLPNVDTRMARIRITAIDELGNKGNALSSAPFVIDSAAPESRAFFSAQQPVEQFQEFSAPAKPVGALPVKNDNARAKEVKSLFAVGDVEVAAQKVAQWLRAMPNSKQAHIYNGKIMLINRDYTGARDEFLRVLVQDRRSGEAHGFLGQCYAATGDLGQAIDEYKLALKINPMNGDTLAHLGVAYFKTKKYGAATTALKNAVVNGKGTGTVYWYLARSAESQNAWPQAVVYWKEALSCYGSESNLGRKAQAQLLRAMENARR